MSLPLDLLVARESWLDDQVLVCAVKDGIVLRRPHDTVDRLATLNDLRSHHSSSRPGLDLTVFTGCSQRSFITPFNANYGGRVSGLRSGDVLLDSAGLADELERTVSASKGKDLL